MSPKPVPKTSGSTPKIIHAWKDTFTETYTAPENWWLEDEISFCSLLVSGRVFLFQSIVSRVHGNFPVFDNVVVNYTISVPSLAPTLYSELLYIHIYNFCPSSLTPMIHNKSTTGVMALLPNGLVPLVKMLWENQIKTMGLHPRKSRKLRWRAPKWCFGSDDSF